MTDATVGGSGIARLFYEPEIAIEFKPVGLGDVTPGADARPLFNALTLRRPWRRLAARLGSPGSFDGTRLAASAPTELTPPTGRRVCGWASASRMAPRRRAAQDVCFSAKASPEAPDDLWRGCLDRAKCRPTVGRRSPTWTCRLASPP